MRKTGREEVVGKEGEGIIFGQNVEAVSSCTLRTVHTLVLESELTTGCVPRRHSSSTLESHSNHSSTRAPVQEIKMKNRTAVNS